MRIELNDVAAVRRASVDIDGITVVAGVNDTGKSTVSKALWCMFDSFYKYEEQFDSYRLEAIRSAMRSTPSGRQSFFLFPFAEDISSEVNKHIDAIRKDPSAIERLVRSNIASSIADGSDLYPVNDEDIMQLCQDIEHIVSYDDDQLIRGVLNKNFASEFSRQVSNVDCPDGSATITLTIRNSPMTATISNGKVASLSSTAHLDVRAIYIDDAFILDDAGDMFFRSNGLFDEDRHQRLKRLLSIHERPDGNVLSSIMAADKLSDVMSQIERALPGDLKSQSAMTLAYLPTGYKRAINARNISAGMKIFAIIKLLLQNGSIERKSTLILDEPEVHLHPEWQLVFAELIVLLQVAFDLHVLLTTHSPYFLRAIQVYAAKHRIASRCKYYQSKRMDKWCEISDVTASTEVLFNELVRPFEELEREMVML